MKKFNSTLASKEAGFTLIEILIAIVLLAFITFGVVSVTENAINTKDRTTEANANNLQIETAMSRFEWDFSQIYSPLYFSSVLNMNNQFAADGQVNGQVQAGGVQAAGGAQAGMVTPEQQQYYEMLAQRFERNEHFSSVSKEGHPIPRFYAPEKNVFEFFTSSNRRKLENQKQSHFAWVRYSLTEQTQTETEEQNPNLPKSLKSLVRYFVADDPYSDKRIDIEDAERVKAAVLLRNVESLEFQYWDLQRRKWEPTLRNVPQGENLVRGVKILMTWYDSTGSKRTTSRIFRTHWPLVSPQDQGTTGGAAQAAAGVQGGETATAGVNAGTEGGLLQGGGVQ